MPTTKEIAQRPTASRATTDAFTECYDAEHTEGGEICFDCVHNAIANYAKTYVLALAEEAEQEARENKGGISTYSKYYRASIVAAWLREKGQ